MQTRIALLASTAAAALALATPANAKGLWYVNVVGGANFIDDNDFSVNPAGFTTLTWNTEADTGFIVAGAVGMYFGNVMSGLRGEVEVSWRSNQVDGDWRSNYSAVTPFASGTISYDHQTFAVLANVWWDIPVGGGINPYIGGGVGWADTDIEGDYVCVGGGNCVGGAFDFSEDGFAWQLGAGINFDISPNVMLGVGYRFFQGPEPTALPDQFTFNISRHDLDNQNHSAILNLTFVM